MSDKLMEKKQTNDISAVINEGCSFEGKLVFEGTARIGGNFKGDIYTSDTLIISETAKVEGTIEAGIVIVNGHFVGNILARRRIEVHHPAVIKGNIKSPSLKVDEGVIFEGSSNMLQS